MHYESNQSKPYNIELAKLVTEWEIRKPGQLQFITMLLEQASLSCVGAYLSTTRRIAVLHATVPRSHASDDVNCVPCG